MLKSLLVRHRFTCPGEAGSPPEKQMAYCPKCAQMALLAEMGKEEIEHCDKCDKPITTQPRYCDDCYGDAIK